MNAEDVRGQGKRVLIVDDSVDTAQMMRILLMMDGYEAETAYRGRDALMVASKFVPDVVLLDLTLPDMSGCEVASALRRCEATASVLIVAISGYDEQGVPPGFDHFLVKPLDHDALKAILRSAVHRSVATKLKDAIASRES